MGLRRGLVLLYKILLVTKLAAKTISTFNSVFLIKDIHFIL